MCSIEWMRTSSSRKSEMKILIITTGGTIDKVYFDAKSDYEIGDTQVPQILAESNVTLEYDVLSLLRKDSLEVTDEDREHIRSVIAERPDSPEANFVKAKIELAEGDSEAAKRSLEAALTARPPRVCSATFRDRASRAGSSINTVAR